MEEYYTMNVWDSTAKYLGTERRAGESDDELQVRLHMILTDLLRRILGS